MSNLIKVYSIKYDENEKRLIDMNEKAEMYQKMFLDESHERKLPKEASEHSQNSSEENGEVQFIEGLSAITVECVGDEETKEKGFTAEELEEIRQDELKIVEEEAQRILEEANEKANRILAKAETEAKQLKAETYEKAKKDGYNEGKQTADKEILQLKKELESEKQKLDENYEKQIKSMEPEFVELLISFIKKLTGYAIEEKKDIITYLVEQALNGVENSNSYIIKVSKADYEIVNSKKNDILWSLKEGVELEIVEDKLLSRAQCVIETDSRVIDCSLDVQFRNLIGDLRLLAGITPEYPELGK